MTFFLKRLKIWVRLKIIKKFQVDLMFYFDILMKIMKFRNKINISFDNNSLNTKNEYKNESMNRI